MSNSASIVTTPQQLRLDLEVAVEREIDGVGMGVLSDGTPFLNIRGLARMCGVNHASIIRITADWLQTPPRPREQKIRELVRAQGADDTIAFIAVNKNFLPNDDESQFEMNIRAPEGTSVQATDLIASRLAARIRQAGRKP